MRPYRSNPIGLTPADIGTGYYRADLVFDGVDHSGGSFALRVFFNNPDATGETEITAENGYAGSVYVFGHGGCFGDEGHCDVPVRRRAFDHRPPHQLTPAKMWIEVTGAIRQLSQRQEQLVITVVPVMPGEAAQDSPVPFQKVSLVTYA
jgi:tyrosinase